jgi:hypothetical protein
MLTSRFCSLCLRSKIGFLTPERIIPATGCVSYSHISYWPGAPQISVKKEALGKDKPQCKPGAK